MPHGHEWMSQEELPAARFGLVAHKCFMALWQAARAMDKCGTLLLFFACTIQ